AELATNGGGKWQTVSVDGPLKVTTDVALDPTRAGAPPAFTLSNGQAQANRVTIDRLSVDAVTAQFGYASDTITVTPLRCTALGGTWTYRGMLPAGRVGRWSGDLSATGIDADTLRTTLTLGDERAAVSGRFDLSARLSGSGTSDVTATGAAKLASDAFA